MNKRPIIFISSTVYGIEELLERVYTLLNTFGYEVWMSHKGTVPVFSNKNAFENCIQGVEKADLFFGIITQNYGSGINNETNMSITHEEIKKAIELNKPRWILAHEHVVFARKFLIDMGYKTKEERSSLKLKQKATSISDFRVIEMYEDAILSQKPLLDRQGNWVQKFEKDEDALLFTTSQFSRFQEIEAFIKENMPLSKVSKEIKNKGAKS